MMLDRTGIRFYYAEPAAAAAWSPRPIASSHLTDDPCCRRSSSAYSALSSTVGLVVLTVGTVGARRAASICHAPLFSLDQPHLVGWKVEDIAHIVGAEVDAIDRLRQFLG